MKVGYWTMSKICRGGGKCSHILGNICCVWRYTVYTLVLCHTFLNLKIGSKIDCVLYTGMYSFMKEIPVTLVCN